MQSMDEQPTNGPTHPERPAQENLDGHASYGGGVGQSSAEVGTGQEKRYQGASEQIPPFYPQTPVSYEPPQPSSTQGGVVPPPTGPAWNYPPSPEQYRNGATRLSGGAVTRPFVPLHNQQADAHFGHSYQAGTSYDAPTEQVAQPGWVPHTQAGMLGYRPTPPRRTGTGVRTGTLIALVVLIALIFGVGLFAGWEFGHANGTALSPTGFQSGNHTTAPVPQLTSNNADVVREAVINKVQPGIVQINVTSASQQALGSGVVIDARGYIVTNNHVVTGANSIQVTLSNNVVLPAQVVGTDAADDLAVVKITPPSSGLTTVAFGDSSQLHVGQGVLAIGSPLGNAETVTSGIVSALNRNVSEGQNGPTLPDAIQTDAPINPGNSGGALVDMQGNLIGMPTLNAIDTEFNTPANGVGFAIPVNRIHFIAQQIVANGQVSHTGRAIMGVTVTNVTAKLVTQNHLSTTAGALVVSVNAGGPADSAGMKAGDVIVQVGNAVINSTSDVSMALLHQKPGETVAAKIYRGSQQLTLQVNLGELPSS